MRVFKSLIILTVLFYLIGAFAQSNEDCLECHEDSELTMEKGNLEISLYVDGDILKHSVHADLECVDCHSSIDLDEHPDEGEKEHVFCGNCHDDVQRDYDTGIHGRAFHARQAFAPTCMECHGKHNILSPSDPKSPTYKMNIPFLCGKCHREGAPVAKVYNINEHNILENYSLSIHGEGLFKKGLSVTAACVDCHNSHLILPHTDVRSSIAPHNVARTCMKCHSRIEDVHKKIIEGEKWRKDPKSVPTCTDCHLPHKARKESVVLTLSDQSCLKCHAKDDIHKIVNGEKVSLRVVAEDIKSSIHNEVSCVKCHSDVNPRLKRPCKTAGKVDCSNCHVKTAEEYAKSGHAKALQEGVKDAPQCTTCHGDHLIKGNLDEDSRTYRAAVPSLCGSCHRSDSPVSKIKELAEVSAYQDYSMSVHGRGLQEKGLLPSAVCTDCHTAHQVLKHDDPQSSVYPRNIPATCATCHIGIYKDYIKSVHFSPDEKKMRDLPTCTNCHSSHTIQVVQEDIFMTQVTQTCGSCHEQLSKTYLETMHGKAYRLGELGAAKCSDCHTAHKVLPPSDPNSSVGLYHIVETCQKCHEDANERFTGYLTHATHHDPVKYPILYYTYWAMTILLISVFSFFGIHTLLWLPRSFRQMLQRKKEGKQKESRYYIKRFEFAHRVTHLFVILSFLSLALTGMMLKFSGMPWAKTLAQIIGGVKVAGTIHRIAAIITFGYFVSHIYLLIKRKRQTKKGFFEFFFGKNSMMFNKKDLTDFWATLKWFIGLGQKPGYGRWTYWEKFDYFAVFWGVFVIGSSGLMLWLPEFFTNWVPGWLINVATIIHSDEALLAVGFIFTVHFFNTHLRPEAFPMDKVIFTGLVPLEEYKKERPYEYQRLKESGALRKLVVKDYIPQKWDRLVAFFGFLFLSIGIVLIFLIIYSELAGYK